MPIISMFYGIIVWMYLLDSKHHNFPHIHARYGEFEATTGIGDGEILAGNCHASNCAWCRHGSNCTGMN